MLVPRYEVKLVRSGNSKYEVIRGSTDAKRICIETTRAIFEDSPVEKFAIICLDTKHRPIGVHVVTQGTINASLVDCRGVFCPAILLQSHAIILCHNHPTGDLQPSLEDRQVTKRLKQAGELLGIPILDHIIVGVDPNSNEFNSLSMSEHGLV